MPERLDRVKAAGLHKGETRNGEGYATSVAASSSEAAAAHGAVFPGRMDFEFTVERDGSRSVVRVLRSSKAAEMDQVVQNARAGAAS